MKREVSKDVVIIRREKLTHLINADGSSYNPWVVFYCGKKDSAVNAQYQSTLFTKVFALADNPCLECARFVGEGANVYRC